DDLEKSRIVPELIHRAHDRAPSRVDPDCLEVRTRHLGHAFRLGDAAPPSGTRGRLRSGRPARVCGGDSRLGCSLIREAPGFLTAGPLSGRTGRSWLPLRWRVRETERRIYISEFTPPSGRDPCASFWPSIRSAKMQGVFPSRIADSS